ncbi:hypothetical protein CLRAG_00850 [Clostridium ragsdalei P11]|uniref:Uncharacterized protein n=1 Tax=Clostridium ragsdalei P11 TaxID=1353534 RepID=A0A1A6B493_9CLOT|nr:hypothetical protein [Clostridium ragsdalei]OBR97166.1 hypothetical protein CLRAG_00850 [Clostridium ragsdalei P11]
MKKICSIINANLKNNLQSVSLVSIYFGIALICTAVIGMIGIKSVIDPAIESGKINSEMYSYVLGILGYCTAFIVTGISYSTFYEFILNQCITVCTYIALPIVYFCLSLLMNLVGLIGKVMDAGAIGIIFVSGIAALMINIVSSIYSYHYCSVCKISVIYSR